MSGQLRTKEVEMSKAAISMFVFSIYMVSVGLTLLVAPNFFFNVLGFPMTDEVWIRIVGMLMVILGYCEIQAARNEVRPFFVWSVHCRVPIIFIFIVFVALNFVKPILLLFGVIDLSGAIWTWLALRSSQ